MHAILSRRASARILLILCLAFAGTVRADETRATMDRVYAALSELLPISLDEERFDTPAGIERMESALGVLEGAADDLAAHAGSRTAEFDALARSFRSNIALLRQSLDYGRYHEFNYLVLDLTSNCVSCHVRLPAESGPDFAADLAEAVREDLYSELDRAMLQVATRQFDAAMTTLEGIINDPDVEPLALELDGVLFDYLNVGITVLGRTARVADTLETLQEKPGMPYYMVRYAGQWAAQLASLGDELDAAPTLARARTLFEESTRLSPVPSSQVRVVHDLVVASMLRRLIESGGLDQAESAEAYWMLGVISIRTVNPRPGVPHTELLLESAIRAAPGSEVARHSYALLEEYHRVSFAGIGSAELPGPILDIDELRELAGVESGR